jgi:hypothetical protein
MKTKILAYLAFLFGLIYVLSACKKEEISSRAVIVVSAPSLPEVRGWYASGTLSDVPPTFSKGRKTSSSRWLAMNWDQLDTISNGLRPLLYVPIEGVARNFVNGYHGYRRVVAGRNSDGKISAVIIEVIQKGNSASPNQINLFFRDLYNAYEAKQIAHLEGFTGFAAFYNQDNRYITGRNYVKGTPSSTAAWIDFVSSAGPNDSTSKKRISADIDCVRSTTHEAACGTYECQETVIWTCTVSGTGGGYTGGYNGGGYTGGYNGGYNGGGGYTGGYSGGGGGYSSGGGGNGGPIDNEPYDDGSGNGYGGYTEPNVFTTLGSQIQYNQLALVNPCPKLTEAWRPLLTFIPPLSVTNRLNSLSASEKSQIILVPDGQLTYPADSWQIQSIQNAGGVAVNLDYFPIVVDQLPDGYSSPEALLREMRLNFNGHINTLLTRFEPHPLLAGEAALWQSSNPLGAIISIGIPGNDGSVITSSYAPDHWTFSTLHEPMNANHPVSGTREFGFFPNPGGGYTFYVRGADRIDNKYAELLGSITNPPVPFLAADATWESWQREFTLFITSKKGKASFDVNDNVKNRPDWSEVLKALRNGTPLRSIRC